MSDAEYEELIACLPTKVYRWLSSVAEERSGHFSYQEYRNTLIVMIRDYKEAHDL